MEEVMRISLSRTLRRTVTVAGTAVAAVLAIALPAAAHTPIMLDETDVIPWQAPLSVNGDDPLSYYGTLPHAGAIRSYQFDSPAEHPLNFALLIPDLAPENQLSTAALPRIILIAPNAQVTVISPTVREVVSIPELGQQYLRVSKYEAPAVAGRYSVIITGLAAARFNISSGHHGVDFHGIERGQVATFDQVVAWYNTAP
jgi:hypothetical protein